MYRTTTELTTSFATSIAKLLGLGSGERVVEVVIRAVSWVFEVVHRKIGRRALLAQSQNTNLV
jgi:hypothetical protein